MNKKIESMGIIDQSSCCEDINKKEEEIDYIYSENIASLRPNKRPADYIAQHIKSKYITTEDRSEKTRRNIEKAIMSSNDFAGDLNIVSFIIENQGLGSDLYMEQRKEIRELKNKWAILNNDTFGKNDTVIQINFELDTGYISINGSQKLADEVFLLSGLDDKELQNKYMVVHYLELLEKYRNTVF